MKIVISSKESSSDNKYNKKKKNTNNETNNNDDYSHNSIEVFRLKTIKKKNRDIKFFIISK